MAGSGLKKNTSAALSALLGATIVVPILFLVIEKDAYVRFWAMQSLVTFAALWILQVVFVPLTFLTLGLLGGLVWILSIILWLIMTYKAWMGEEWEVPVLGKLSRQLLSKI